MAKKPIAKKYPVRTFRMADDIYDALVEMGKLENRKPANMIAELILRRKAELKDK